MTGSALSNLKPSAQRPVESDGVVSGRIDPKAVDSAGLDSPGGEFVRVESAGVAWTIRADLAPQLLPGLRRAADNPAGDRAVETVKNGPHRTVYRLSLSVGEFYLKHFRVNNWKTWLLNVAPPNQGRPGMARCAAHRAAGPADIRTGGAGPNPHQRYGCRQLPRQPWNPPRDSAGRVRGTDVAAPKRNGARRRVEKHDPDAHRQSELRQQLTMALGDLTGRLHRAAVEHADFHAANILVRIGADGLPALWLIDLHRVYFRSVLSRDQRFSNLAFLHQFFTGKTTRADRLRFYRAYKRVAGACCAPAQPPRRCRNALRSPAWRTI